MRDVHMDFKRNKRKLGFHSKLFNYGNISYGLMS